MNTRDVSRGARWPRSPLKSWTVVSAAWGRGGPRAPCWRPGGVVRTARPTCRDGVPASDPVGLTGTLLGKALVCTQHLSVPVGFLGFCFQAPLQNEQTGSHCPCLPVPPAPVHTGCSCRLPLRTGLGLRPRPRDTDRQKGQTPTAGPSPAVPKAWCG